MLTQLRCRNIMHEGEQKDRIKARLLERYDAANAAVTGGWISKIALYLSGGAPDGVRISLAWARLALLRRFLHQQ